MTLFQLKVKLIVCVHRDCLIGSSQKLVQSVDGAPQMGNRYRATYDKCHIKCVKKLRSRYPNINALFDMVSDTVITAQDS
jgi:hypothetical protein